MAKLNSRPGPARSPVGDTLRRSVLVDALIMALNASNLFTHIAALNSCTYIFFCLFSRCNLLDNYRPAGEICIGQSVCVRNALYIAIPIVCAGCTCVCCMLQAGHKRTDFIIRLFKYIMTLDWTENGRLFANWEINRHTNNARKITFNI